MKPHVMAYANRHEEVRSQGLVYVPCPACGKVVALLDGNRVLEDPETYECPECEGRFYLREP
ncbi:MAG: hypothetical protein H0V79_09635 [Actinobacteria bacterium]|nr:hypothetical protein [Actinomycetota bacterium]